MSSLDNHDDRRRGSESTRRVAREGGRRITDRKAGEPWTPTQLAEHINMSPDFVRSEIRAGEIAASQFGRDWRIHDGEVRRYLEQKRFPLPPP